MPSNLCSKEMGRFYLELAQEFVEEENFLENLNEMQNRLCFQSSLWPLLWQSSSNWGKGKFRIKRNIGVCKVVFNDSWTWYYAGIFMKINTLLIMSWKTIDKWLDFIGMPWWTILSYRNLMGQTDINFSNCSC